MTNTKTYTCFSCGYINDKVEAQGIWYCPNALCKGCGGAWFRRTLKSYKENDDKRTHTVDEREWRIKGIMHNLKEGIRRYSFYRTPNQTKKEDKMIDTIQPIGSRVLIIPYKEQLKQGSLLLPNQKEEFHQVISVGEDVENIKAGDIVLVNIYHGNVFRHPEFMIVDESAIVGIKND